MATRSTSIARLRTARILVVGLGVLSLVALARVDTARAHRPISAWWPATIGPGQPLPGDDECAQPARKRGVPAENLVAGEPKPAPDPWLARVTGAQTGSSRAIVEWAACKWGVDPAVVAAQIDLESSGEPGALGDYTNDAQWCPPGVTALPCAQSVGPLQVKWRYHAWAWPLAPRSAAWNIDYALAVMRTCFDGGEPWLGEPHSGVTIYTPGDWWACAGRWYSGQWHTPPARTYIDELRNRLAAQA